MAAIVEVCPALYEGCIYRQLAVFKAVTVGFCGAHSLVLVLA